MRDTNLPDVLLWIVKEKLSDGSEAFNVEIPEFSLAATDINAAVDLARIIADAINEHTANTADVMEG